MSSKDRAASVMAAKHYEIEEGMRQIFRVRAEASIEERPEEPFKLLEVNEHTFAVGVMPLHFGPVPNLGIDYPCIIIEVTPEEFKLIEKNELELPNSWTLGEQMPRPAAAA